MSKGNGNIYLAADELAVVRAALNVYIHALDGKEFGGGHAEADQGMRARTNLAKAARAKIIRQQEARAGV